MRHHIHKHTTTTTTGRAALAHKNRTDQRSDALWLWNINSGAPGIRNQFYSAPLQTHKKQQISSSSSSLVSFSFGVTLFLSLSFIYLYSLSQPIDIYTFLSKIDVYLLICSGCLFCLFIFSLLLCILSTFSLYRLFRLLILIFYSLCRARLFVFF